jgi:hypothetical protein
MPRQTNEAALEACMERHLADGVNDMAATGSLRDDEFGATY